MKTLSIQSIILIILCLMTAFAHHPLSAQKLYGLTSEGGTGNLGAIIEYDLGKGTLSAPFSMEFYDGENPQYTELREYQGKFYGMTFLGGANDNGVIFEWDPATNAYTKKLDFDGINGKSPSGSLTLKDGKFYGMTTWGGSNDRGVIFEWDPATNTYTKKVDLSSINGQFPHGSLTLKDDKFYGMTNSGGFVGGVIFEWDPANNVYTKKVEFSSATGRSPYGSLTLKDSKFYGMTANGGAENGGVIFEWNPASNTYTKKVDFRGYNGESPYGNLTLKNGKFYGMTEKGGANDRGVIFEWDPASNTFTNKVDFDGANGRSPSGSLTLKDGKFYGMTNNGGADNTGGIFEWDPATNIYTKKLDFDGTNGRSPSGSLTLKDGKLYGMTRIGGKESDGVIFEWDPASNIYTKKVDFNGIDGRSPQGSLTLKDDKIYGMTSDGGSSDLGVIFEWDPATNAYTKKVEFKGANGQSPSGGLTLKDDKFYGMTVGGGANGQGVIFEWDPVSNSYTLKVDFKDADGMNPINSLTLKEDKFYGMTREGGSNGGGVIFEWDPASNIYTKKVDLNSTNGQLPYGGLTFKDGKLYGMTSAGGSSGFGVIFEWDPATNTYTKKVDFNGTNGQFPFGNLTLKDDKFYGMTREGGTNDKGVIFEWDPATNTYTKKIDFNGPNGQSPSGSLTLKDGNFYGMTSEGGASGFGVVFEWDPVGNNYKKLADFNGENGRNPIYGHLLDIEPPDTSPPSSFTLKPGAVSETSIILNWGPAKDNKGITGYDIFKITPSKGFPVRPVLIGSTTKTSFTVDDLTPCTTYSFIVKAKDAAGNTSSSNTVNVSTTDETPPVIPDLPEISGCTVTVRVPIATDICAGEIKGTTTDPLTYDSPGTYTLTWTFNDRNGNISRATQNIEVINGPKPVFSATDVCLGETLSFADNSNNVEDGATYLWDFGDNNTSTTVGDESHTYVDAGEYTVTLTITQGDCSATRSQTVTVHPLPEVTLNLFEKVCLGTPAFALTGGMPEGGVYSGDFVDNGAFDPIASGAGSFAITYTLINENGCENSATQTLVVSGDTPPVAVTQDLTLALDENGEATLSAEQIDNGSNYGCSGAAFSLDQTLFTCDDIGENTVTLTLTDGSGNTASETAIVTIVDDNPPQITAPDAILVSNDPDQCGAIVVLDIPVTADNCGVQEITSDAPALFEVGTTIVTWAVVDVNGNESKIIQTVEVTNDAPLLGDIMTTLDSVMIGNTLNVNAPFTDNNLESIEWDWGDGSFTEGQMETEFITGSHNYEAGGLYTLKLAVTDACGTQATAILESVIVYNPDDGMVTGIEDDLFNNQVNEPDFFLNIYPNPLVDQPLHLEFKGDKTGSALVKIFDMRGQSVLEHEVGIVSGDNNIDLETTLFTRGQYVVYFEMGSRVVMKKVIKY